MGRRLAVVMFSMAIVISGIVAAQAAGETLDPDFSDDGLVFEDFDEYDVATAVLVDNQGRLLVGGSARDGGSGVNGVILRYLPDGSPDTSFGGDGQVTLTGPAGNFGIASMAFDASGSIVAVGQVLGGGFTSRMAAVRVDSSGVVDALFGASGYAIFDFYADYSSLNDVKVSASGAIVIAGSTGDTSNRAIGIGRLLSDGSLDRSFSSDGMTGLSVGYGWNGSSAVLTDAAGRVTVVGWSDLSPTTWVMTRLEEDGDPDPTFGSGGLIVEYLDGYAFPGDAVLKDDGKIVVVGSVRTGHDNYAIAQFNADGSLDKSFGSDGVTLIEPADGDGILNGVALLADGRIVAVGQNKLAGGGSSAIMIVTDKDGNLALSRGSSRITSLTVGVIGGFDSHLGVAVKPTGEVVAVGQEDPNTDNLPYSIGSTDFLVAQYLAPSFDTFVDDDGSVFEADIEWLAGEGITQGCNPPVNDMFCPNDAVTRGQMAAFLVRALGLTDDGGGNSFVDDDGSVFESSIAKLAAAGITQGCNPPDNDMFCPNDAVTREQMAAFLVRALGYSDDGGGDIFDDDDGSIFETQIDKLATAGVTRGCNPPANTMFCPTDEVTRGQMAAFLRRALAGS